MSQPDSLTKSNSVVKVAGGRRREGTASEAELDNEEREFCQASGALGLDPLSPDEAVRSRVIEACSLVPREAREDFLAAVNPSTIFEVAGAVRESLKGITESQSHCWD